MNFWIHSVSLHLYNIHKNYWHLLKYSTCEELIYFSAWDHLFRWEGSMSPVKCKLNSHWADKTDHHCRYDPGTLSNTVSVPAHSELVNIPCPDCPVSRCCRPLGCGHGGHRGLERRLLHTGPSHGDHEVRGPQWPVDILVAWGGR